VILTLDHIQLAMPAGGEAEARHFWGALVGVSEIPKPTALAARGGCWFQLARGQELHLGVEAAFQPAKKAHPGFVVDDIDALATRLGAGGAIINWDHDLSDRRRFFTTDPFGNRLEFMMYSCPQPA